MFPKFTVMFLVIAYIIAGFVFNFVIQTKDKSSITQITETNYLFTRDHEKDAIIDSYSKKFVHRCYDSCDDIYEEYIQNKTKSYIVSDYYVQHGKKVFVAVDMKCLYSDYECVDEMFERNTKEIISNIFTWIEKLFVIVSINQHKIFNYLTTTFVELLFKLLFMSPSIVFAYYVLLYAIKISNENTKQHRR